MTDADLLRGAAAAVAKDYLADMEHPEGTLRLHRCDVVSVFRAMVDADAEVTKLREILRGAAFALIESPCRCSSTGGFRCTPCKSRDEIRAALGEEVSGG